MLAVQWLEEPPADVDLGGPYAGSPKPPANIAEAHSRLCPLLAALWTPDVHSLYGSARELEWSFEAADLDDFRRGFWVPRLDPLMSQVVPGLFLLNPVALPGDAEGVRAALGVDCVEPDWGGWNFSAYGLPWYLRSYNVPVLPGPHAKGDHVELDLTQLSDWQVRREGAVVAGGFYNPMAHA